MKCAEDIYFWVVRILINADLGNTVSRKTELYFKKKYVAITAGSINYGIETTRRKP